MSTLTANPAKLAPSAGSRPNLAHEFLRARGETVEDWDGVCGELANELIGPEDSIIWVGGDIQWRYHMVPLIGGLIHDAWCDGDALPLADWLAKMFGDSCVTVAQNGDDFYEGPASEFKDENDGTELLARRDKPSTGEARERRAS